MEVTALVCIGHIIPIEWGCVCPNRPQSELAAERRRRERDGENHQRALEKAKKLVVYNLNCMIIALEDASQNPLFNNNPGLAVPNDENALYVQREVARLVDIRNRIQGYSSQPQAGLRAEADIAPVRVYYMELPQKERDAFWKARRSQLPMTFVHFARGIFCAPSALFGSAEQKKFGVMKSNEFVKSADWLYRMVISPDRASTLLAVDSSNIWIREAIHKLKVANQRGLFGPEKGVSTDLERQSQTNWTARTCRRS